MQTHNFELKEGLLKGVCWMPDNPNDTEKILIIAHGITEYIERYESIAKSMTKDDTTVLGIDMRGHGNSTREGITWDTLVDDFNSCVNYAIKFFPTKPIYILGFSFGSFIVRDWLNHQSDKTLSNIKSIILAGTGEQSASEIAIAQFMVNMMSKKNPPNSNPPLLKKLTFDTYNKNFKPNDSEIDWLLTSAYARERYTEDKVHGKVQDGFTIELFKALLEGMKNCRKPIVNHDVLVSFVSGDEDPVGKFTKAVKHVAGRYKKAGYPVKVKFLEWYRHDWIHDDGLDSVDILVRAMVM